ncbi:MAG: C40 family peptidase [Ferruginibacter sp.]
MNCRFSLTKSFLLYGLLMGMLGACMENKPAPLPQETVDSGRIIAADTIPEPDSVQPVAPAGIHVIDTRHTDPEKLVAFAKTLIGIPYLYGSSDPAKGFDCSGFISYVFNHFNIEVPRSSVDFTNVPVEIPEQAAKAGDLILFTGTDSTISIVGHMGIVTENNSAGIRFIHSSSGKAYGVTTSPLEGYYRGRFVKVIRVF